MGNYKDNSVKNKFFDCKGGATLIYRSVSFDVNLMASLTFGSACQVNVIASWMLYDKNAMSFHKNTPCLTKGTIIPYEMYFITYVKCTDIIKILIPLKRLNLGI